MSALVAGKHTRQRRLALPRRGLAALFLSGLLVLTGAQAASAHAELLSTTPENGAVLDQPPAEAVLTFNEPVQLISGSIRLFPGDADPLLLDAHVDNTSVVAALPAEVADGAYALSYRVVSADGHPISGAITFTVGEERQDGVTTAAGESATPASTQFALSCLTALQYLSLLLFAGLILFQRLVLRSTALPDHGFRSVARLCGIGAAASSLLLIPVSALNVTGEPLAALIDPTAWWPGVLWAPTIAAVAVCAGSAGSAALATRQRERRRTRMLAILLPLLALSAPVLVGHTQLKHPRVLIVAADIGHLVGGCFWIGGVLGLLLFLAACRVTGDQTTGIAPALVVDTVQRFSRTAVWSVVILAVSGIVMGAMIVGSVEALITTSYGLTLLLKIGIIIPVIAIAAYNRCRLLPRISSRPTARMQWRALIRTLSYEAALLAAVLLLTGFLTNLSPGHEHHDAPIPHTAAARTVTIDAAAQGLSVQGQLKPAQIGQNEFSFILEYEGEPVFPDEVSVRTRHAEHDLGPFLTAATPDPATGRYSVDLDIPVTGEWEVQVVARVSTFSEPIVTIPVPLTN